MNVAETLFDGLDVAAGADRRGADMNVARSRARDAFRLADVQALKVSFMMRLLALAVIAVWLGILNGLPSALFYWALLVGFVALGYGQYRAGRNGEMVILYAFILLDALLMAFAILTDNPIGTAEFPPGQKLHQSRETYFFVLLAGVAACYEPRRVLWAGFCIMAAWTLGFLWVATHPDAVTIFDGAEPPSLEGWIELSASPNFVNYNRLAQSLILFALVAGILAMVTARTRSLVRGQIAATRERANLARYFAPAMVEELSNKDAVFEAVQAKSAAVLFVDVVGFTAMAEGIPPEQVIGFLRALHGRIERAIFENGGTLDKYMGDGAMAIFGAPETGPDDACRAIASARAIHDAARDWNLVRDRAGFPPVKLAVGVHYGPVVTGDIGSERRLEFATIGDAVNLASRLEAATRRVEADILISAATAGRARQESPDRAAALLDGFVPLPALDLPGHSPIDALGLMR